MPRVRMRLFPFALFGFAAGAALALHAAASGMRSRETASGPVPAPAAASPGARPEGTASGPASGIAVAELFTSEGCSSCPPADRLLAGLAAEAAAAGRPVFTLSFHVDYWNDLGWADPFSRAEYAARQKAYAAALGGGVYTPELIVNGKDAFVGSDAGRARRAIRAALRRPARASFRHAQANAETEAGRMAEPEAEATRTDGPGEGSIRVTFDLAGAPAGVVVRLALVQPDTAVPVGRGENGGRTLRHHDVVRAFATVRPGPQGPTQARLPVPPGARTEALRVILYTQDPESLEILGAAETAVTAGPGDAAPP